MHKSLLPLGLTNFYMFGWSLIFCSETLDPGNFFVCMSFPYVY
jgi:hypothetical protein